MSLCPDQRPRGFVKWVGAYQETDLSLNRHRKLWEKVKTFLIFRTLSTNRDLEFFSARKFKLAIYR